MGIMDKARETAEQARRLATQSTPAPGADSEPEGGAAKPRGGLDQFKTQAKSAAKMGRSSFATIVEKIDPSILADLIIKATAAQEKANLSLREKQSPYRIAEITITATIPPQIGFTVARTDTLEGTAAADELHSAELIDEGMADETPVMSLEGEHDPGAA